MKRLATLLSAWTMFFATAVASDAPAIYKDVGEEVMLPSILELNIVEPVIPGSVEIQFAEIGYAYVSPEALPLPPDLDKKTFLLNTYDCPQVLPNTCLKHRQNSYRYSCWQQKSASKFIKEV